MMKPVPELLSARVPRRPKSRAGEAPASCPHASGSSCSATRDRCRSSAPTIGPARPSKRSTPGDGVVGAHGTVGGRPVYCYAQDQSFAGGSLGAAHAETIVRVMRLAGRAGAPVVGFIESGGARMDDGIHALGGYGRIFHETVRLSGACRRSPSSPASPPAAAPTRPR